MLNEVYYNKNAKELFEIYESIDSNTLFSDIRQFIPTRGYCLDIGCGSGRDAHWLETLGNNVTAIDPSEELLALAKNKHGDTVRWVTEKLPDLETFIPQAKFDFILVSAVWMHIPIQLRRTSLVKINRLLSDNGYLVLTIRNQSNEKLRFFYQSNWRRLKKDFKKCGFEICHQSSSRDGFNRKGVHWLKIVLKKKNTSTTK